MERRTPFAFFKAGRGLAIERGVTPGALGHGDDAGPEPLVDRGDTVDFPEIVEDPDPVTRVDTPRLRIPRMEVDGEPGVVGFPQSAVDHA